MSTLQTLDRGIRALSVVADRPGGITVSDLASELGVARAISYRLVATLEEHGLLSRSRDGRIHLGAALVALAAQYWPSLQTIAAPILQDLADHTEVSAFLSIAEGQEAVAVLSMHPRPAPLLRIGYQVGSRHTLERGASGIAILAGRPASQHDSADVIAARKLGYSCTRDHLEPGAVGIAAPLRLSSVAGGPEASIGLVALEGFNAETAAPAIIAAAARISSSSP